MSFKFNWGHGMFVTMTLFVIFIGNFVYKVMVQEKYDHKLVSEEYYKEELHYQDEIDSQNNANTLSEKVFINQDAKGLLITFPSEFDFTQIKAHLKLQRPSNDDLDIEKDITLNSNQYLIPDNHLVKGRYNLKLDWNYKGKAYQIRERITY